MKSIQDAKPIRGDLTLQIANEIINIITKRFDVQLSPLGSVGKKTKEQYSGDIDLAIQYSWDNYNDILDYLQETLNCEIGNINHNLHVFNIGYKYLDEDIQKIAQVDFMFVDDIFYARFAFNSPDYTRNESRYKGIHQSALLMSIISNTPTEYPTKYDENNQIISYWKYFLNQYRGLYLEHKSFEGKTKRLKSPKTIKEDEIFITNNPIEIVRLCLGDKADLNICNSFESEFDFIFSKDYKYYSKEQLNKIKNGFLNDWQLKMKCDKSLLNEFEILFNKKLKMI